MVDADRQTAYVVGPAMTAGLSAASVGLGWVTYGAMTGTRTPWLVVLTLPLTLVTAQAAVGCASMWVDAWQYVHKDFWELWRV